MLPSLSCCIYQESSHASTQLHLSLYRSVRLPACMPVTSICAFACVGTTAASQSLYTQAYLARHVTVQSSRPPSDCPLACAGVSSPLSSSLSLFSPSLPLLQLSPSHHARVIRLSPQHSPLHRNRQTQRPNAHAEAVGALSVSAKEIKEASATRRRRNGCGGGGRERRSGG